MEQPSSPGTRPVELRDCIEELMKFTLQAYTDQTLGLDLHLSKDFCFQLLNDSYHSDSEQALPQSLYQRLASILCEFITYGSFSETTMFMESYNLDNDLRERGKWDKLILDEGTQLLNILKSVNFEIDVQEPFFTQLRDGLKTVEGRCAVGDYNQIESGALILFNKCLVLQVQDIHRYASFAEMLEAESLEKVLPGVKTIDEGVKVYRKFYTEAKERANGVLAICVAKSSAQPYIPLAGILSGLSYKGIANYLGQHYFPGTIPA
ncbi:hypothetical protein P3X46_000357 [Hevea brasiliensis]|uniref:ASCH domain-containing protein n=1 Tax=Hevea brasiliensis TaxID=3981 RepID=A0ABQ9N9S9_HEVBR|nr:uncharacterized protein LOC110673082 isoform X2 [Hevea brasiliensis]KAJ9189014.1 hypothetical protein P3X46_000357 [Hevea brasiliensis]